MFAIIINLDRELIFSGHNTDVFSKLFELGRDNNIHKVELLRRNITGYLSICLILKFAGE